MSTITVLCGPELFALVEPLRGSAALDRFGRPVHVAEFDTDRLLDVPEAAIDAAGTWWREVGRAVTEVPYRPDEIREAGSVFTWLSDVVGVSNGKNTAACFGEMAASAGMDPVTFADHLADLIEAP